MEAPAELGGLITAGTIIASVVIGILAYLFKRPDPQPTSIRGAAIIDSSVGHSLVDAMKDLIEIEKRTAAATEGICKLIAERERYAAAERDRAEIEELRREIAELRKPSRRGG